MACELIGAKLVAPFFGGSLYVWSAVLGITLTALMSGYYFGGWLSEKSKNVFKSSLIVLTIGGLFMSIMPTIANKIMVSTLDMSIASGATLSLLIFMFPPLFLFGTTSPLFIELLNSQKIKAGRSSGTIYSISTFGGILATFLLGFYLIPEFGLKFPSLIIGITLLLAVAFGFLKAKKLIPTFANVGVCVLLFIGHIETSTAQSYTGNYSLLHKAEGVFGQIKIIDRNDFYTYWRGGPFNARVMMVNNSAQSYAFADNPKETLWDWAYFYKAVAALSEKKDNALLLGLGGGSFYHQLVDLGFNNVDVVELDQRIKDLSIQYFGVPETANIIVDDARHYINVNSKLYDVIMMDLFRNEVAATHVLTKECFGKLKSSLSENGMIIMNFYGFTSGKMGVPVKSIVKTMQHVGLKTKIIHTPNELENERNLVIIGSEHEVNLTDISPEMVRSGDDRFNSKIIQVLQGNELKFDSSELNQLGILTDELPKLEKLYVELALAWRRDVTHYNTKKLLEHNI